MEYDFVFVGDNGQGDVRVAELISTDKKLFENLERVYIHQVQPLHMTHAVEKQKILTNNCPFVCYFTTYVDAAIDAYEHKLIRLSGLRRIAEEAVLDFERIPWDLFGHNTQTTDLGTKKQNRLTPKREKRRHSSQLQVHLKESFRKRYMRLLELNHSLVAANAILVKNGLKPVQLLRFQCLFPRGTLVNTLMGLGVVDKFRYHDGIYEVRLAQGLKDDCTGGDMAYLRSDSLAKANRPRSRFMGVFWSRSSQDNRFQDPVLSKGPWIAWTPYGMAKTITERSDNIIVLKTNWGATMYLHASKVVKMKAAPEPTLPHSLPAPTLTPAPTSAPPRAKSVPDTQLRGFWSRLFGRPTPPLTATLNSASSSSSSSSSSLKQQSSQDENLQPPSQKNSILILCSLFEVLESFLLAYKTENTNLNLPLNGPFVHKNKWIEIVTCYGKGKLLDLIVRADSVHLKLFLNWGGIGYLALNTVQSYQIKEDSSELEAIPFVPLDSLLNLDEAIDNIRRIRGGFQCLSQS